jgi:hypothetical protein
MGMPAFDYVLDEHEAEFYRLCEEFLEWQMAHSKEEFRKSNPDIKPETADRFFDMVWLECIDRDIKRHGKPVTTPDKALKIAKKKIFAHRKAFEVKNNAG